MYTENDRKTAVTITPLSKKAQTHLVQSPGNQTPSTFARQPTLQRMHHNIPHRFEQKLCMRTGKCSACLDSIHFGQYASTCQECGTTAHPKASHQISKSLSRSVCIVFISDSIRTVWFSFEYFGICLQCALILPSTCGLPREFVRHFSKSWKSTEVDSTNSSASDSSEVSVKLKGFVKIPK